MSIFWLANCVLYSLYVSMFTYRLVIIFIFRVNSCRLTGTYMAADWYLCGFQEALCSLDNIFAADLKLYGGWLVALRLTVTIMAADWRRLNCSFMATYRYLCGWFGTLWRLTGMITAADLKLCIWRINVTLMRAVGCSNIFSIFYFLLFFFSSFWMDAEKLWINCNNNF